jgi:hypothetical protein
MQRALLLLTVLFACFGGTAVAQDLFAGGSLDFRSGLRTPVTLTAHIGVRDAVENFDIRGDLGMAFVNNQVGFQGGLNFLYRYDVEQQPLSIYGGGGPRMVTYGTGAAFALGMLFGTEYEVSDGVGLYGELGIDPYLVSVDTFNMPLTTLVGLGFGAKFYF